MRRHPSRRAGAVPLPGGRQRRYAWPHAGDLQPAYRTEEQVLELIVREGYSNEELAAELGTTTRTAKFHVGNLLRKTAATDRLKLAVGFWRAQLKGKERTRRPSVVARQVATAKATPPPRAPSRRRRV